MKNKNMKNKDVVKEIMQTKKEIMQINENIRRLIKNYVERKKTSDYIR
jgi:hypothetical protein